MPVLHYEVINFHFLYAETTIFSKVFAILTLQHLHSFTRQYNWYQYSPKQAIQCYTGFPSFIKLLMGAFAEPRLSNIVVMIDSRNRWTAKMKQIFSIASNSLHLHVQFCIHYCSKQIKSQLPHHIKTFYDAQNFLVMQTMLFYSTITCVILIESQLPIISFLITSASCFSFGSLILTYMITWQSHFLFLIKKRFKFP